jgi:hypothetical protein
MNKDKPMVLMEMGTVQTIADFFKSGEASDEVIKAFEKLESNLNHTKRVLAREEEIIVGDIVEPKPGWNTLRAGRNAYGQAVVISLDPFVLISQDGESVWTGGNEPKNFNMVGTVNEQKLKTLTFIVETRKKA